MHAWAMLLVMVMAAPQHQIVEIGGPRRVRNQVVGFTPGSGNLAAWPAAATIAHQQDPVLVVAC